MPVKRPRAFLKTAVALTTVRAGMHIEWTALGPRVFVLGRRIHEWQVGAATLVLVAAGLALGWWDLTTVTGSLALAGVWLLVKDWRDTIPSLRDTSAWRLGIHRPPAPLRPRRRGDWLPPLAAAVTALVALVSLTSTLDPSLSLRGLLVLHLGPISFVPAVHAFVLPASGALLLSSLLLLKRRRRACQLAIAVLLGLAVGNLLKGLQIEDALLALGAAGLLFWGREGFHVRHDRISLRSSLWRVPLLAAGAALLAGTAVWATAPAHASFTTALRETIDLLLWSPGPLPLSDDLKWLPYGVGAVGFLALAAVAYTIFRPLAAPRSRAGGQVRAAAMELVRRHGSDTLSFFKLREDGHYLFSSDGCAFVAYRIENGVLLLSGDPVGPAEAMPGIVKEVCAYAETAGLRVGAVGAGSALLALWRQAGLRSLYVGDEAVIDADRFSLEGRAIRKVRQSVSRLQAAGYSAELRLVGSLSEAELDALDEVSARWRGSTPERGFSMAMDSLRSGGLEESLVVIGRDGSGAIRGFLHFVPVYGRPAASLSLMRRERGTPNGFMEFLVVRAIEGLRERGVREVSLNFAAFARWLHAPRSRAERLLGRLVSLANPWFQIESLYRFNAKFFPRWEPRYVLYESPLALPRTGLAVLWAEGQLPRLRLRPAAV
jgi:lysyl-tRNA synthetase class 2